MSNDAAVAYTILAGITIILFILTRWVNIRIIRCDTTTISMEFIILKFSYTKNKNNTKTLSSPEKTDDSSISVNDAIYLLSTLYRYLKKCKITIRKLVLPKKEKANSFNYFFAFYTFASIIVAYIDSQVEKLDIKNNALVFNEPQKMIEFDLSFSIILIDAIFLVFRLLHYIIKAEKRNKANVRN